MNKRLMLALLSSVVAVQLLAPASVGAGMQKNNASAPQIQKSSSRPNSDQVKARIAEQVRHELALLPWYGVFDWIEGQVTSDGAVTLRGMVTRPTTMSDAEFRVKRLESVSKVVNRIEVLPLSSSDNAIRVATYRAIFNYNGPLYRYALGSRPSLHIIVKNGRITLKGVVSNSMDKQLAYTAARQVPGAFEVTDELRVEGRG